MAGYKLATYQTADGPRAGLVVDDKIVRCRQGDRQAGLRDRAGHPQRLEDRARRAEGRGGQGRQEQGQEPAARQGQAAGAGPLPVGDLIVQARTIRTTPTKWRRRHGRPPPPDPHTLGLESWHFIKASRSITNPGATVKISNYSQKMDWEVELAAVIGKPAKNVPINKALSYVAGYTIANDLSARDRGRRPHIPDNSPFKADWVAHKSFDGSCPLGPWIVPASDIKDPQKLGIKLWVNGVLKQDSNTSQMIFNARRADRAPVVAADAASRRPDPDRYAGRRRRRAAASSSRPATP